MYTRNHIHTSIDVSLFVLFCSIRNDRSKPPLFTHIYVAIAYETHVCLQKWKWNVNKFAIQSKLWHFVHCVLMSWMSFRTWKNHSIPIQFEVFCFKLIFYKIRINSILISNVVQIFFWKNVKRYHLELENNYKTKKYSLENINSIEFFSKCRQMVLRTTTELSL